MIFGIVHVASDRDILFFAGLKAQGMTPRQIRYFLLAKVGLITLFGLIPGWLTGFLLDVLITGRVIIGMEEHPALYFLNWPPFALAAACTLGTVLLSYLLPALRLSHRLPALLFREQAGSGKKGRGCPDGRMTLLRLALRTLRRSRGRMVLSAGVLLLATLLLSYLWLIFLGLQEDVYLSALSPWDYSITDGSAALSLQIYNQDSHALTEEAVQAFRARPETTSVSALKTREVPMTASAELQKRLTDFYNQPYDESRSLRDTQAAFPEWGKGLDRLEQTGEYTALIIGLEGVYLDYLLEYCPFTSGSFDEEQFLSGGFVITGGAYHEGVSAPMAGETVTLADRTFTVMGSVMHDDAYISGSDSPAAAFSIAYIVPLSVFDALFPGQGIRQIAVNIDHSAQDSFETWLDGWSQSLKYGAGISRRSEYQENFRNARLNTVLPRLIVGAVLMGIALLNLCNLLAAKAVSRKQEFAVYESLGMTGRQLARLLALEGLLYAALCILIVGPPTLLFTCFVMPDVVNNYSWASAYTFSLAPLCIILPDDAMYSNLYDLIISDIMMPGTDGFEFAKTVRGLNKTIPILFMSARDDLPAKKKGFDLGIDDYMVKPIEFSELLMRVRALLRRANIEASRKLTVGSLRLDADGLSAEIDGEEIPVTTREFNIIYKLLSYPNHTFSRSQLMDEFWGVESDTGLRAVDVYITKLRDKFSVCKDFEIKTVRGLGYKAVLK